KYDVEEVKYKKGAFITPEDVDNSKENWIDFNHKKDHWYGPDGYYWFRTKYTIPKELNNKCVAVHIKTQISHWDDGRNPQFLLFVNGVATQGLDMNHRTVILTECAKEGEVYNFDLQSYTGSLYSEFTLIFEIIEIDRKVEKLYYDIKTPYSAFNRLDKESKAKINLEKVLNDAINILDLRTPYSEEFYNSVEKATNYLETELYEKLTGYDDVIATCIGHTHIDVAWLWTTEQTKQKVCRSFATVLKLMEEYPNYKFFSSQPQLYKYVKERHPDLYEKIKKYIKEGRWEAEGGMWIEADCNLTSGESLVRQFIYGKRFFKDEFGINNNILWLPDVFGYSGALPQIMKKCGIDYFMTTKLAWNQINKIPNDTMIWRGIDGTEILAHFITTLGIGQKEEDFFTTYNGMLHPDAIIGGWKRYQNKNINNDILVCYGHGDGGGGPTREMLEMSKRMEKGIEGIPKVRQEFVINYFKQLEERVKDNNRLPLWEGEFYFEYHRGTYTSMGRNKRSNRRCEQMLMDLEFLNVLTGKNNKEELDEIWENVLLNQFHDILPGTSIKEVYEMTKEQYDKIEKRLAQLINERLKELCGTGEYVTIYNTLGFNRNDVVILENCNGNALKDEKGNIYPIQNTEENSIVYVENIPSKGKKSFEIINAEEGNSKFIIEKNNIETPFYKVIFNENGIITKIYDKENERDVLQENAKANLMRMYEDKPMAYNNWDIDMYYTEKFWDIEDVVSMEWVEIGAVRATLKIERKVSNSKIIQKIHFYSNIRRIDFETYVDWKDKEHLLKVHFPVLVHTDEATFDIQFGNLTRKVHRNTSWDKARFETCGQKWIDLSEGHYGVSLLNDCKYGHSIKDSDIALTLIKSGTEPFKETDQEEHFFTYSLYPHKERWNDAKTVDEAYKLNQKAYAIVGTNKNEESSFINTDKRNVIIETIKEAENKDGIIIRVFECENSLTKAKITIDGVNIKAIEECNLIEEFENNVEFKNNEFEILIKPYEIKTFRIKR
ncbi:MAG: alpha-mannosidase, partial [Eubacteriales bacterium]|nr:alpha-mannosidase [Eubacteriales bacterium]